MNAQGDGRETKPVPESDVSGFDRRLAAAEAKLSSARGQNGSSEQSVSAQDMSALGMALRLGTELVAGLVVGVAVGYALDRWLGFRALFLILFSLLGSAAGMLNVLRVAIQTDDGDKAP